MTDPRPEDAARHAEKKARIKAARDRMMQGRTAGKGLVIVHTGPGKGKSSSGLGMILRCIAHGMPCAVAQFIKGARFSGEREILSVRFVVLRRFHTMKEWLAMETWDVSGSRAAAARVRDVVVFLRSEKPPMTHGVLTGRNVRPEPIALADLVTGMQAVKHPFRDGIKAQPGVEF